MSTAAIPFTGFWQYAAAEELPPPDPADDPSADTPFGLLDFRACLTELEAGFRGPVDDFWCVTYASFLGDRTTGETVPVAEPHFVRARVQELFQEWRASRPERQAFALLMEEVHILEDWEGRDPDHGDEPGIAVQLVRAS